MIDHWLLIVCCAVGFWFAFGPFIAMIHYFLRDRSKAVTVGEAEAYALVVVLTLFGAVVLSVVVNSIAHRLVTTEYRSVWCSRS